MSSLLEPWQFEPEEINNAQTPFLDLGHIYGKGPWDQHDKRFYDGVRLKTSAVAAEQQGTTGGNFDVAMDENSEPLVADRRSCEDQDQPPPKRDPQFFSESLWPSL